MDPTALKGLDTAHAAPLWENDVDPRRRALRLRLRARWRRLPLALRILGWLLLALFAVWLILFVTKGRFLKHPAERLASGMLEREVTVAGDFQLYFAPFSIKFLAEGLTIANPDWARETGPFFRADLIDTRISTSRLLFGQRLVKRLALRGGALDLRWSQDGARNTWTFGNPDAPGEPLEIPRILRALVTGTTLRYEDPRLRFAAQVRIDTVRATDTRFDDAIGFSGTGTMRAEPFTLRGSLLSPNETVAGGRNRFTLAARAGATAMDVTGTLAGATQIEGADLDLEVRGRNLADLFDFLGVAVPDTRSYRMTSDLTYADGQWRLTGLRGLFGESDLAGRMTISMPSDRLLVEAALATARLHVVDVAPFVGYDAARIERQGAAGAIEQVGGVPRILPDAPLRVEAIRRFDAKLDYRVRTIVGRDIPISDVRLGLSLDRSVLRLAPLDFAMAGGRVSAEIGINARDVPVRTDYDIRLSPTPMGQLLARWGVDESGTTGTIKARVRMSGVGDTVRRSLATSHGRIAVILPRGTMWTRNVQLAELDVGVFVQKLFEERLKEPVQINCGLIAFTVRDGIASADPILIDTAKNVMLGRGSFSFRDESLDLAVRADGKKFSLFSGQSPVGVTGHFAAPGIAPLSPELIARAGAGAGLGAVLSPLAAVLAFVDVGDARSADCGPVLDGAQATRQRTGKGEPRDDVGRGTPSKREDGR